MKVDRRSFLGLGLGAAAGVAVTPATWKLMDDSSIWTQNWPWTPVPPAGEATYDNTVCTLCPGNCGLMVRKIDGRPVKIEGRKDYPVNAGGVCLHGISAIQYLYDPSRIKTPLKRENDAFVEITWDEALNMVAERLSEIRASGSADRIACVTDQAKGTLAGLFARFLKAFGSNNAYAMDTMEKTWEATLEKIHGKRSSAGFDLENSDFVLSFGAGILEGWGSPVKNFRINSSRKERGATLVQVEPRLSNTAANADVWIAAKPGTEADLAFGMAAVIIKENLFNTAFVTPAGTGLQELAAVLAKEYGPEAVEQTTGIKAAKIIEIARDFARSSAPIAIAGRGRGMSAGSVREFSAVHLLNCIVGNINTKGGVWTLAAQDYEKWPDVELDDLATAALEQAPLDPAGSMAGLFATAGREKTVEALLIHQANPCFALDDARAVTEAVRKIPFVVSFSSVMDETTREADVILPGHMLLERLEDRPSGAGVTQRVTGLSRPVIEPVFNTRNPGDVLLALAQKMEGTIGASFPWESYEECLEAVTGDLWADLSDQGYAAETDTPPKGAVKVDFSFIVKSRTPVEMEGDAKAFPLVLVPVDNVRISAGSLISSPFAVKTVADTVLKGKDLLVEINPETARANKLSHGDLAVIETPKGKATVRVNLFEGIMPGVVAMAKGLGHVLDSNKYVGGKGVNINELMGPVVDPVSGLDAAWGIRASISRA